MAPQSGHLELLGVPIWIFVYVSLATMHALVTYLLKNAPFFAGSPFSKDPMLAGHFLPQLCGFMVFAIYGTWAWLEMPAEVPPIGAYLFPGEVLTSLMIGFQMYELTAAVLSKRLRGNAYEMIIHHIVTLLLASLGYYYQAFLYFGAFFFGVSEISSLPLAFVDLFKHFTGLRAQYPGLNEAARTTFAVTFLAIRGIYWPLVSFSFWKISLATLADASFEPSAVIYTFFVANIILTLLQWYWTFLIVSALIKKFNGGTTAKDEDEEGVSHSAADYLLQKGAAAETP